MTGINNQAYELSIWKDVIIPKAGAVAEHFDEVKVATIGSNTLDTAIKAHNVTLKENINGEKTLTFNLLRKYQDEENGLLLDNPFLNLLSNESRLKLRVGEAYPFSDDLHELTEEDIEEKWIDFVIKSKDEDSDSYLSTFVAKEIFINELGKNGYSVTLDTELENNYGTINELGEKILEDSGWVVGGVSYSPTERIAQPLLKTTLQASLTAKRIIPTSSSNITIPSGAVIYPIYGSVKWDAVANQWKFIDGELQFLYKGSGLTFSTNDADDNRIIIDDELIYNYSTIAIPNTLALSLAESALQGNAIVKTINSHFDKINDEYVKEYKVTNAAAGLSVGSNVLGTTETEYLTSSIVTNFLTNNKNFVSSLGWLPQEVVAGRPTANAVPYPVLTSGIAITNTGGATPKLTFTLPKADAVGKITYNKSDGSKTSYYYKASDYGGAPSGTNYNFSIPATSFSATPLPTGNYSLTYSLNATEWINIKSTNYLTLPMAMANNIVYNQGPSNIRLSLVKDNIYVVRVKARMIKRNATDYGTNGQDISTANQPTIKVQLGNYSGMVFTSKSSEGSLNLISSKLDSSTDKDIRGYGKITSENDAKSKRVRYVNASTGAANVDELRYSYCYIKANSSTLASIDKIHLQIKNTTISSSHDYYIEDVQVFNYIEDINNVPIFLGDIPTSEIKFINHYYYLNSNDEKIFLVQNDSYYAPSYKSNYEAVRHLDIKQSNYFNNITSLAELFEVWVRFKIYHQKNGKLLLDLNGQPRKEVIFSRYSPNGSSVNHAGFKYGINLKGIQRSGDSAALATKVIVKNNNQEFAVDGMCSISRAKDNPSGENEIYNFDYFVSQGLINSNQLLADLYGMSSTDMALYPKLSASNNILRTNLLLVAQYEKEIVIATNYRSLAQEALDTIEEELAFQRGLRDTVVNDTIAKEKAQAAIAALEGQKISYTQSFNAYDNNVISYTALRDNTTNNIITPELLLKKTLKKNFYTKYSRFIQEGTWTDDKYIDDDLYYLDALKVSTISAYPKTSYQINVIDLNGLEEYSSYKFKVGERTFIEDTEFFGWSIKNISGIGEIKTPFKMEVIVSERTRDFDDITKSSIVVQNYKNQFEELFQKISAATTQLQYESGGYGRAAQAIKPNGEIELSTLELAMENNAFTLSNSKNQSVVWDSNRGIEITDTSNSNLKLRMVAGGLFMTTDGGATWVSGITGRGINTNYLLAGQIDASKINILSNGSPIFRWDSEGVSAFYNEGAQYSAEKYVRFNQYGLYGTTDGLGLTQALTAATLYEEKLQAIRNNSNFSLTWDGLFLQYQDGAVSLSPEDGFQVFDASRVERVRIGNFAYSKGGASVYGLRLSDSSGLPTLETDPSGNLWLQKYLNVNDQAGISGETLLIGDPIDDARFWAGASYANRNSANTPLRITKSGYLYATNALLSGDIEANNLNIINGSIVERLYVGLPTDVDSRIIINGLNNTIRASNNSWVIDGTGQATFNNARIRGTLETVVFKYDEVTAVSGSLLITNSAALEENLVIGSKGSTVEMTTTLSFDLFNINDVLAIPIVVDGNKRTTWLRVISKSASNRKISAIITTDSEMENTTLPVGSTILNFGSSDTAPAILIKGYGDSAPYMDLFQAERSGTNDSGVSYDYLDAKPSVRIGNLEGIYDTDFGDLSGYGLYADNIFIKGKIIANEAIIRNSTLTGNLYAGTLDTDNIIISDRRIASSNDDWKFIIHPDATDGDSLANKSLYKFLMVEQGVFNKNYDWMFYSEDGQSSDLDLPFNGILTDTIFAKIDSSKRAIIGEKIGTSYWEDSYLYQTELYRNGVRFSSSLVPSISGSYSDNFMDNFVPSLTIGAYKDNYNFIAGGPGKILSIGAAKVEPGSDITLIDSTNILKVGINTTAPRHELDVAHSIGVADKLFFTGGAADKVKIEKHANGALFDLDIFLL